MFDGVVRELMEVRYVPELYKNLISVGSLESKGLKVTMENGGSKVTEGSLVIMKAVRDRNLYYLRGSTVTVDLAVSDGEKELGVSADKSLQAATRQGFRDGVICSTEFSEQCAVSSKKRVKFGTVIHYHEGLLDVVHVDVCRPSKEASLGGHSGLFLLWMGILGVYR